MTGAGRMRGQSRCRSPKCWPYANELTSADGGWRVEFSFVARRPAAAEFFVMRSDDIMRLHHNTAMVLFMGLLAASFLTGCGTTHNGQVIINDPNLVVPYLEGVRYTKLATGPTNELVFVVNAGKDWPGKRDYFGKCERCSYSLSLPNGANAFVASDMDIRVSSRPSERNFHPKGGRVTITEQNSGRIVVEVHIDDDRFPRLINGTYTLIAGGVCYESEQRR